MNLPAYSFGIGDRFGREGEAQLRAFVMAREAGVEIAPVWNKSHREHTIIGTTPDAVRAEADAAVRALGWEAPYFVDADHIGMKNVDGFIAASDFFTIDVADFTGTAPEAGALEAFVEAHAGLAGETALPDTDIVMTIGVDDIRRTAAHYLTAMREAGRVYRHIAASRGEGTFVTEVSVDETDRAQSPAELLVILAALADEGVPARTIAPKFTGAFHKGVDYIGELDTFRAEFEADLAVIRYAVDRFDLPSDLKLSVHSGSDKFSLYGIIGDAVRRHGAGLHLKTAGTTWLEELIGLAAAGGDGLRLAQEVYREAHGRFDELCGPYAAVIDIDRAILPSPETVSGWTSGDFTAALRHDPACPAYDPQVRQLLHVGYKVAAEMGDRFLGALEAHAEVVGRNVTETLYERHVQRLFALG